MYTVTYNAYQIVSECVHNNPVSTESRVFMNELEVIAKSLPVKFMEDKDWENNKHLWGQVNNTG